MKLPKIIIGVSGIGLSCCAGRVTAFIEDLVSISEPGTAPWFRRDTLVIDNKSSKDVQYFYSSWHDHGQDTWYLHDVKPFGTHTWD